MTTHSTKSTYNQMITEAKAEFDKYLRGEIEFRARTFKGDGLTVTCLFGHSEENLIQELISHIEHVAGKTHTKLVISEMEKGGIHPHGTIGEGRCVHNLSAKEETYEKIKADVRTISVLKSLDGLEIEFDTLIVKLGSILLASTTIPKEILSSRKDLKEIFSNYGIDFKVKDPIFYITLARTIEPIPKNSVMEYLFSLKKLQKQLAEKPLRAKVSSVYIGTSDQMIPTQMRPNLTN